MSIVNSLGNKEGGGAVKTPPRAKKFNNCSLYKSLINQIIHFYELKKINIKFFLASSEPAAMLNQTKKWLN